MADSPGGASALRRTAPFGFRYQYLAGGVNTGQGWATWNPDGSFVTLYDTRVVGRRDDPRLQLLPAPAVAAGRAGRRGARRPRPPRRPATMAAYWARRAAVLPAGARHEGRRAPRRARPLGLHRAGARSGDDAATVPGGRPGRPAPERRRLRPGVRPAPRPARAERDPRLPPEHLGHEARHPLREAARRDRPRLRGTLGRASTARSHAHFDLSFEDFSDRDAGFYAARRAQPGHVVGAGRLRPPPPLREDVRPRSPASGWSRGRSRSATPPCGPRTTPGTTTRTTASSGCSARGSRAHLRAYVEAGFVGFLFGRGADGAPAPATRPRTASRTRRRSTATPTARCSADDDGGYFAARLARTTQPARCRCRRTDAQGGRGG